MIIGLTTPMRSRVAAAGGRPLAALTRPAVALILWIVVWYGVHLALFYDWALRDGWPLNLEHGLLLAAGLVFWWPVLGEPRRLGSLGVLAYLGIAFITAPWLSLAYIFASSPFYSFYAEAPRLWGLSPIRDQNLAGILMNAEQTSIIFIAFAWALLRVLADEEENSSASPTPRTSRLITNKIVAVGTVRDRIRMLAFFTPWVSIPLAFLGIVLRADLSAAADHARSPGSACRSRSSRRSRSPSTCARATGSRFSTARRSASSTGSSAGPRRSAERAARSRRPT